MTTPKPPPPALREIREAIEAAAQGYPLPRGQDWWDVLLLVNAIEKHLAELETE
jgi:hypothetical protein